MWLNPFGNQATHDAVNGTERPGSEPNQNSAELINWFFVNSSTFLETELFVLDATLSGRTGWELAGGEVFYGLGVQYRQNHFSAIYGDNNNIAVNSIGLKTQLRVIILTKGSAKHRPRY